MRSGLCGIFLLSMSCTSSVMSQTAGPCNAPSTITCAKFSVAQRLEREASHLVGTAFKPTDGERVAVIDKGGSEEFRVDLEANVEYAIVAACGYDCGHVEVALLNEKQEQLATSTERQAVLILSGAMPAQGTYIITVSAPGCNHIFCGVGIAIMRR